MTPWFIESPDPSIYLGDNYLVLDFECTNRKHGSPYDPANRLLLACWSVGRGHPDSGQGSGVRRHWGTEFEQSDLLGAIGRADYFIAHFTKFELGWLERCGLDLRHTLPYCTQIGEYVFAGNRKLAGGLGLEASCARYGLHGKRSFVAKLIEAGVCPSEIPRQALEEYCANDVVITERLFLRQRERLAELKLLPVTFARNLLTPVLVDIEPRGMCLDPQRVEETYSDYSGRYNKLLSDFQALTGGINPKSGKQMREYLYTKLAFEEVTDHRGTPLRTSGGTKGTPQARTDKKVLPLLRAVTKEQKEFKELAIEIAKLKVPVQNLKKMQAIVAKGGVPLTYATLNQTVTGTGRLSSSAQGEGDFQQQNTDRAFKRLFKARQPGWVLIDADAPQLEFRVAAHLGNDEVARKEIVEGADVHALTAAVYKCDRQDAKPRTFAPLYGSTSGTAQDKAYQKAFRAKYKAIFEEQTRWTWKVASEKQLRIASGLIFYWPDTEVQRSGYIKNTTSIFNYPIQSFATADIIPLSLVLLWHELSSSQAYLVNTTHDSVLIEAPECEVDSLLDCVVECLTVKIYDMLKSLYDVEFSVPLGVGIKVAEYWSEGKEQKHNGAVPQKDSK